MGRPHKKLLALHKRYGQIVRIAPDELSFTHPDSWKEIQGHVKQGQPENGKDPKIFDPSRDSSLVTAVRDRHGPMRRTLSAAFSARAMAAQQPLINGYLDLFMQRLREKGESGAKPLNMTKWFEWVTFDIVGDLAMGESFQCVQRAGSHPFVDNIVNTIKVLPLNQALHYFPIPAGLRGPLFLLLAPKETLSGDALLKNFSQAAIKKRMSLGSERPDFVEAMLKTGGEYVSRLIHSLSSSRAFSRHFAWTC
jgi:cytochrome P450